MNQEDPYGPSPVHVSLPIRVWQTSQVTWSLGLWEGDLGEGSGYKSELIRIYIGNDLTG